MGRTCTHGTARGDGRDERLYNCIGRFRYPQLLCRGDIEHCRMLLILSLSMFSCFCCCGALQILQRKSRVRQFALRGRQLPLPHVLPSAWWVPLC